MLNEHVIDVYVNDRLTMKLICLPQHLAELVLGRLLTETLITSADDMEHIYICEYGRRAKVYLKQTAGADVSTSDSYVEITPTCCTCNHILNNYFISAREPEILTPIHWEPKWIFHMAMKVIQAGIPILASKASPTFEAIELAKEYHLTLICAARKDRMKVFV